MKIKRFFESFKLNKTFLKILLYDLLFYAISMPTLFIAASLMAKKARGIDQSPIDAQILLSSPEKVNALASEAQSVLIFMVTLFIVLIIINLAAWSLSRGLIYTTLLKKKFTKIYFFKFFGLNFLVGILLLMNMIFFSNSLAFITPSSIYTFLAASIVVAYFTTLYYVFFTKTGYVFSSIGKALSTGFQKLPKLIIPGLLVIGVFIISILINYGINKIIVSTFIALLVFSIFLTWERIYFVKEIEKVI